MDSKFDPKNFKQLFKPEGETKNGQVTIIGGSRLFHGAPLFSLTVASKIVDMVFFSSPEPSISGVANSLKSRLFSFIWVPWNEVGEYVNKSDAILIGPGLMRYQSEKNEEDNPDGEDKMGEFTKELTHKILNEFPNKKWVIDAGSLQAMESSLIPEGSIITPNAKEYKKLFGDIDPREASLKFKCTILLKGIVDRVCSDGECVEISGGNAGMAKGGTGDTLAGLTVALFAKNDAKTSAAFASYITKRAGDELYKKFGANFNADDLASKVPEILAQLQK